MTDLLEGVEGKNFEGTCFPGGFGDMPSVTVLIPAYNAGAFVEEAIDSALAQRGVNLEILVVDDGSKDDTAAKIRRFAPPVRLLQVRHGGPAWARNHGMRASRGEFVTFLDADDLLEEGAISRSVKFLKRCHELGFVFSNGRVFGASGVLSSPCNPLEVYGEEKEVVFYNPLKEIFSARLMVLTSGLCARRETLRDVGFFDEGLWGGEDFEYWCRIYLRKPVGYIAEPLVRIRRDHAGSITRDAKRLIPFMAIATEKVMRELRDAGQRAAVRSVREYSRRCIQRGLLGMLGQGDRRGTASLLWKYREILLSPAWYLLLAGCVLPGWSLKVLSKNWLLWRGQWRMLSQKSR